MAQKKSPFYRTIKEDRLLKLKIIYSTELISNELKNRNIFFTVQCGLFKVKLKKSIFFIQIDNGDTITSCWTNVSYDRCFILCENDIIIEEFISQLDDIIITINKLYKLKNKIDKQIIDIRDSIRCSNIDNVVINQYYFEDLNFGNMIITE